MVALHFLTRGKTRISGVVHVNHGTPYAAQAESLVAATCERIGIPLDVHRIGLSTEQGWSDERRRIFNGYEARVMTAHHLDDVVEWYVYTSLRYGMGRVTPFQTGNVVHPFRLNSKATLRAYAWDHNVDFCEDPTNEDGCSNARAKIRSIRSVLDSLAPNLIGDVRRMIAAERLGLDSLPG